MQGADRADHRHRCRKIRVPQDLLLYSRIGSARAIKKDRRLLSPQFELLPNLGDDKLHEWSKTKLERLIRYIRENKEKDIRQHYQKAQRLADVRAAWVDDWAPLIIE